MLLDSVLVKGGGVGVWFAQSMHSLVWGKVTVHTYCSNHLLNIIVEEFFDHVSLCLYVCVCVCMCVQKIDLLAEYQEQERSNKEKINLVVIGRFFLYVYIYIY